MKTNLPKKTIRNLTDDTVELENLKFYIDDETKDMNLPGGIYQKELIDACLADPDLFYKAFADVMDLSDSTHLTSAYLELKDKLVSLGMEDRFPDMSVSKLTDKRLIKYLNKDFSRLEKLGLIPNGFYYYMNDGNIWLHNPNLSRSN